ncbi:MAG: UDP-N-acetylglucosamine 2-epimerase (hydrolyzing) [Chlorobi bacterium]|nr:UDP-N-acetylglucosamine 2-epimerase (hydrolyzing) [Chlorobiota bacterium]
MILNKKIVFLTGTRADFGKIKSLIRILDRTSGFEPYIFATGMHLEEKYGYTVKEIEKSGFRNIHTYSNATSEHTMDLTLAKTIEGFSRYVRQLQPDLIVIHGDRVEPLAGAIVGSLNNILTAHIEGGEVSGTIDDLIRHSISKLAHVHFVANDQAARRLIQMGENPDTVFVIGSPDLDIMFSGDLPGLEKAKSYYEIPFDDYAVVMFHPVTTEVEEMPRHAARFVDALLESGENYLVIYPNNDLGSQFILNEYKRLEGNPRFRILPSIRFEYFLTLLKNASFIIGNSSAGIREAPYYKVPSVNVGTRQNRRAHAPEIINASYDKEHILQAIRRAKTMKPQQTKVDFGTGNSAQLFLQTLQKPGFWQIPKQKTFRDMK